MSALPTLQRFIFSLLVAFAPLTSFAADNLKLAVGAPNNWDTSVPEVGQRAGIFEKHGLKLEIRSERAKLQLNVCTWYYRKMRPCVEQPNVLVSL